MNTTKKLTEENLDCENSLVTGFLTKIAKKLENTFCQMLNVVRQQIS